MGPYGAKPFSTSKLSCAQKSFNSITATLNTDTTKLATSLFTEGKEQLLL